ncbi:MAG: CBS domain-containing protein [Candidatus Eremiobacterota bacterium]
MHRAEPIQPAEIGQVYKELLRRSAEDRFVPEPDPDEPGDGAAFVRRRCSRRTVGDIMSRDVLTVSVTTPVRELAQLLSHRRISGAPVLGPGDRLVGVVSMADLTTYAAHSWARTPPPSERLGFYQDMGLLTGLLAPERIDAETQVGHIMSPYVYYATEDCDLLEMADVMLERQIHRVIVLRDEELVGIVSSLDLIRALRDELT